LGDGTFNETNLPEEIVSNGVTAIAGGGYHSLFLKNDGSLWAMGANYDGQLGDGISYKGASETNRPEMIVGSNVTAIAAGYDHSLFLKSDGSLWAMGGNSYGQLGAGNINSTNRPALIIMNNVIGIGAGQNFSMFIKSDGSLWAMGFNDYGQLGDGTENNTNRPEMIVAPPGYGQLSGRYLEGGRVLLFFAGVAGGNYAVDRTFSLSPSNWLPLITNSAASSGDFIFTNPPMGGTNGFWRVRAIQ